MADSRELRLLFLTDTAEAKAGMAELAAESDATSDAISDGMGKMGSAGEKTGNLFERIGQKIEGWGIPGGAALSKMGSHLDELDSKGQKFGSFMSSLGKATLLGGAAGIVAFGAVSVDSAMKFQSSMELIRTQAGASQAEVNKMSGAVLGMAASVGTSPDDLAAGLYHIESAGIHGAKALDVLKVAAEGAKIGQVSLEDAANVLGPVVNSNMRGVGDYAHAMGVLNATVGAGDMRMGDLLDALVKVMPNAKTAGLSIQDLGAALATMGDLGMRGSTAGIYVRQAIMAMVSPSAKATAALQSIGLSQLQLSEDLHKPNGFLTAMEALKSHLDAGVVPAVAQAQSAFDALPKSLQPIATEILKGTISTSGLTTVLDGLSPTAAAAVTSFEKVATAAGATGAGSATAGKQVLDLSQKAQLLSSALGGVKSSTGVEMLLDNIPRLKSKYDDLDKGAKNFGSDWKATSGTLSFQMDQLKSGVEALADRFGLWLIPKLQDAGKAVGKVIEWFEKHKSVAIALGITIGGFLALAVLKFSVETAGKMVGGTARMAKGLLHLGDTFKKSAGSADENTEADDAARKAISELSASVDKLAETLSAERKALSGNTETSTTATETNLKLSQSELDVAKAAQTVSEAERELSGLLKEGNEAADQMSTGLQAIGDSSPEASEGLEAVAAAASGVGDAADAAAPEVEGLGAAFESALGPIGLIVMAATLVISHWKLTERILKDVWHALEDAFDDAWRFLKRWGPLVLEAIMVPFTGGLSLLVPELIKHWGAVEGFFKEIPGKVEHYFDDAASWLVHAGEDVLKGLWTGFEYTNPIGLVIKFRSQILGGLEDAGKWLLHTGEDIIRGLVHGIEAGEKDAVKAIKDVGHDLLHGLDDVLSIFSPSKETHFRGEMAMRGLANGITDNQHLVIDAAQATAKKLLTVPFVVPTPIVHPSVAGGTAGPLGSTGAFGAPGGIGGTPKQNNVTINVATNANPNQIAKAAVWAMSTAGD